MYDTYKAILKEIQEKSGDISYSKEKYIQEVVKGIFIKEMGYESENLSLIENQGVFWTDDILIKGSVERNWKKELSLFGTQLERKKQNWGILLHPVGMWLFNTEIKTRSDYEFTNQRIILEINYGMNSDQKYFKYFSAACIIGDNKNACFFRDIIEYKNNTYKGQEKSWSAYHSALKRFFEFIAENKDNYSENENPYDRIKFAYFVEFIRKETKCKSIKSARNSFFYIKDFMHVMSEKKEFEKNADEIEKSFPELLKNHEMQDVMCEEKLKIALDFLAKNRNGIRNKCILLFFLAYGLERRKLCALEWENNIYFRDKQLKLNGKRYPMPSYLVESLTILKEKNESSKYVFCNGDNAVLSDGAINTILSGIARVDLEDEFFSQLTPINIRRYLAKYLLKNGYPLEKIFYLMDIEGYKLSSYLSNKDIEDAVWSDCSKIDYPMTQHPLEEFFERLR